MVTLSLLRWGGITVLFGGAWFAARKKFCPKKCTGITQSRLVLLFYGGGGLSIFCGIGLGPRLVFAAAQRTLQLKRLFNGIKDKTAMRFFLLLHMAGAGGGSAGGRKGGETVFRGYLLSMFCAMD